VTYIYKIKKNRASVLGLLGMNVCVNEETTGVSCKFWLVITVRLQGEAASAKPYGRR